MILQLGCCGPGQSIHAYISKFISDTPLFIQFSYTCLFFFFFNVPGTYQSLSYLRAFVHVHAHKKPSDLRWAGTLFHLYISTQSHLLKKAFSCHLIQSRQPSRVFHIVSHLFICCTLRLSCLFTCGFFPSSIPAGKDLV